MQRYKNILVKDKETPGGTMRVFVFSILAAMLFGVAGAVITPFTQLGGGHFAGKMGTYAQGDTLALVYYSKLSPNPDDPGLISFKISTDGGTSWNYSPVASAEDCLTQPTLFYSPEEIIVTYTNGMERRLARSTDGGSSWQAYPTDPEYVPARTFENSPYIERRDGELKLFALDLPYPEYAQDEYSHPDYPDLLLAPQYYSATEESPNETPVYFWGPDVIGGIVRSNSDIWIKQAGGGTNNGWPTFQAPVITSGEIQIFNGAYDEDQVFQGGLIEHAPALEWEIPYGSDVAQIVGPLTYDPDRIVMVTVNGGTYEAMLGQISDPYRIFADVYYPYPPGDTEDYLFRNNYDVRDTVWTPLPGGNCGSRTLWVNSKLWIRGTFATRQTWASADTICIIGDILLTGTPPGTDPATNTSDLVNLVSEKSIVLKYGYKDPVDSLRYHPLCRPDTEPSRIYANLYALGDGAGNPRRDGVFTFEYQHPHPSVPAVYYLQNNVPTYYDNIDLHRYSFPQTAANPWPSAPGNPNPPNIIDYPWYNPLWPERTPYLERGTLQLWGSVNQRRRGFMHRTYYDTEYPNPNGVWNQELDLCGTTSAPNSSYTDPVFGIPLTTTNYPGATGSGIGYKKDFRLDSRHTLDDLDNGPAADQQSLWRLGLNLSSWDGLAEEFASYHRKSQNLRSRSKCFARRGNNALYSVNDLLLFAAGDSVADWSASTVEDGEIRGLALSVEGAALVYQHQTTATGSTMLVRDLAAGTGSVAYEYTYPVSTSLNDVAISEPWNRIWAFYETSGQISVWKTEFGEYLAQVDSWPLNGIDTSLYDLANSRLYVAPSGPYTYEVFLWLRALGNEPNLPGTLFYARAYFTTANVDPAVPSVPSAQLAAWPNPASQFLNVKVQGSGAAVPVVEVYNLRGQLVRRLELTGGKASGEFDSSWDGRDSGGMQVGRGIYVLRLKLDSLPVLSKRVCWL